MIVLKKVMTSRRDFNITYNTGREQFYNIDDIIK